MSGATARSMDSDSFPGIFRRFWRAAAAASHRILMVDYDGTLVPFRVDRMRARPSRRSLLALSSIARDEGTKLAVLSGRPIAELERLLGPLEITLVGEHGWEVRGPDGARAVHEVPRPMREALERVAAEAAARGGGGSLERKRASVVCHVRGLSVRRAARALERFEAIFRKHGPGAGLALVHVHGGLEARAAGRDKGAAVKELILESPPGAFPVYLGDDETDEDAFAQVRAHGYGIRVGSERRPSLARGRLGSWRDVQSFLEAWRGCGTVSPAASNEARPGGAGRRLVVVSNRLPHAGRAGDLGDSDLAVGGLTTALRGALQRTPGSLWFGWSGRIVEAGRESHPVRQSVSGIDLIGLGLTQAEMNDYYLGFCNETLWPLFHCFQGKLRIRLKQLACYRRVQARFAAALRPLLTGDHLVWIHDYHMMLLGRELRRLGFQGRIGFFLHVPFPPHDMWQILPEPGDFLEAMLAYDVVGFHVQGFLDNYVYCCRRELEARWDGSRLHAMGRVQQAGVYPVGIEPEEFLPSDDGGDTAAQRAPLIRAVRGRSLVVGVDRLDYTKGIPERIQAYERFLRQYPARRKKVVYVQVASPSRTGVPEYAEQKKRIEALLGRINGELGEHDWVPIRYLYRSYPREFLARLYREADVGLVTPLRDGMNLVAKEFVAAQDPASPGVLVLSRSAGAAWELREALLVNPFIAADVAAGIERALSMPVEERRERHEALLARVMSSTAGQWSRRFVEDLEGAGRAEASAADESERTRRRERVTR